MGRLWLLACACSAACGAAAVNGSAVSVSAVAPTELSLAEGGTLVITGAGFAVAVLDAFTDEADLEPPTIVLYDGDFFPFEGTPDPTGTELTVVIPAATNLLVDSYQVTVGNFGGPRTTVPEALVIDP